MVESIEQGLLDVKLNEEWTKMSKAQDATKTFIEQSINRGIQSEAGAPSLGILAFFNQKLVILNSWLNIFQDINRLILAEGSGDQVPKVEFGGGG